MALDVSGVFFWLDCKAGRNEDSESWLKKFMTDHWDEFQDRYQNNSYYDDEDNTYVINIRGRWVAMKDDPLNDYDSESDHESEDNEFEDEKEEESRDNPFTGHGRSESALNQDKLKPVGEILSKPPTTDESETEKSNSAKAKRRETQKKKRAEKAKKAKEAKEAEVAAEAAKLKQVPGKTDKVKPAKAATAKKQSEQTVASTTVSAVNAAEESKKQKAEIERLKTLLESAMKSPVPKEQSSSSSKNEKALPKTWASLSRNVTGSK